MTRSIIVLPRHPRTEFQERVGQTKLKWEQRSRGWQSWSMSLEVYSFLRPSSCSRVSYSPIGGDAAQWWCASTANPRRKRCETELVMGRVGSPTVRVRKADDLGAKARGNAAAETASSLKRLTLNRESCTARICVSRSKINCGGVSCLRIHAFLKFGMAFQSSACSWMFCLIRVPWILETSYIAKLHFNEKITS